ncbi:MAG: hypothetical protein KDA84_30480, partial [Planctomycetaceae bacterium]|nr:hypothetical protein [Planctomycetaceae bacterium]
SQRRTALVHPQTHLHLPHSLLDCILCDLECVIPQSLLVYETLGSHDDRWPDWNGNWIWLAVVEPSYAATDLWLVSHNGCVCLGWLRRYLDLFTGPTIPKRGGGVGQNPIT